MVGFIIRKEFSFTGSHELLYELKDHLITCLDLKFIDKTLFDEGIYLTEDAKKTINAYISYVKKRKSRT